MRFVAKAGGFFEQLQGAHAEESILVENKIH